jgi:hypothetical protein
MEQLCREAVRFPQQAQEQVVGPDEFMGQALRFLRCLGQNHLAFAGNRTIDSCGDNLSNRRVCLDLLADQLAPRLTGT